MLRRKYILLLGLLMFGIPKLTHAQVNFVTGSLTAQAAACPTSPGPSSSSTSALTISTVGYGGATFTLGSSAFSATVSFFGSGDGGTTWQPLNAVASNATSAVLTATATGLFQTNVAGYTNVCMVVTTFVSGTVTARIQLSTISARAGGGVSGGGLPAGCTSIPNVSLTCPQFIATSSFLNVGASAQELDLYTAGACNGTSACTGFKFGFLAPPSMAASVVELLPSTDSPNFGGVLQSDGSQHLSWSVPAPLSGRWGMTGWNNGQAAIVNTGILTASGAVCTTPGSANSSATSPPLRTCGTGATANTFQDISYSEATDLTVGTVANPTNLRLITVAKQSATTTIRSWMAVLSDPGASTTALADCPAATNLIGIRFSSVVPDTNFTLVNDNNGTCSTVSTGVAGDTNLHRFEVRLNDATGTSTGCVDSTCVTLATNYPGTFHPGNSSAGGAGVVLDNTTTTAETLSWAWIFIQSQLQ